MSLNSFAYWFRCLVFVPVEHSVSCMWTSRGLLTGAQPYQNMSMCHITADVVSRFTLFLEAALPIFQFRKGFPIIVMR